jgi:3-hydroxyisobutyrate dehydrogenase
VNAAQIAAYSKEHRMKIGFVGLGQMGLVMAPHLLRDDWLGNNWRITGHDLVVPDCLPAGLGFTTNLADLATSDVIITMLPDGAIVTRIVDQLITAGCRALFIDMSSSHPDDSRALAQRLYDTGLDFIDAPVSGGVARARTAALTIMAGGSEAAFATALPILSCMGHPVHLGPAGCGHAMKALNNYVSAAGLIASFQALATAIDCGIPPDRFLEVINGSTGRNNTTEVKIDKFVLNRQFNSGFALALMEKDVSIAASLLANAGHDGPVTASVLAQLRAGLATLGDGADHTEMYRALTGDDGV